MPDGALTLELPLPPNMANARMHWAEKDRKRAAYFKACDTLQLVNLVPPPPPHAFERVSLVSTLYCWSLNDEDNALARIKWAADWCKTRGYIVDDKPPHCRFTVPTQHVDRKNQRLVLTLTPAA